jgi:CMP-N,N'-diacetyllegionaminic acid synthase
MKMLVMIPARGGSKEIPGKNLKNLGGNPLILYTIRQARKIAEDHDICLSTDNQDILEIAGQNDLEVPFIRPAELANDTAAMYDVIMHALNYYEGKGISYDCILLLQPTSPFRTIKNIREAISLYSERIDMVVSVKKTEFHPEALFYENSDGFLEKYIQSSAQRRQDIERFFSYNGAIYIMNTNSLRKQHYCNFTKIIKFEMDNHRSVDLDTQADWDFAEYLLEKKIIVIE